MEFSLQFAPGVRVSASSQCVRPSLGSALDEAGRLADEEVSALTSRMATEHATWRAVLDEGWAALTQNNPDAVMAELAAAFEDNEAAAAAVGVDAPKSTRRLREAASRGSSGRTI